MLPGLIKGISQFKKAGGKGLNQGMLGKLILARPSRSILAGRHQIYPANAVWDSGLVAKTWNLKISHGV